MLVRSGEIPTTLVLGADGQLGRALRAEYGDEPWIEYAGRSALDLAASDLGEARRWRDYDTIINATAYTAVDAAETGDGRRDAWATNGSAFSRLARIAAENRITFVHVSSDSVYDGTSAGAYREDEPLSPLGVYGQTKAVADLIVASVPRHYILRTSWVIGDGKNFVATMRDLAARGVSPRVVDDQVGRLTFTADLAGGIRHLLESAPAYGTYNLTGGGQPTTWCDVAKEVFALTGHDPGRVTGVSTDEYYAEAKSAVAPRPRNSVLDLAKIEATGFVVRPAADSLREYLGE